MVLYTSLEFILTATIDDVKNYLLSLQDQICATLEQADGGTFFEESWERPGGGGGRTRVLENGALLAQWLHLAYLSLLKLQSL